jgi:hypothetical protein
MDALSVQELSIFLAQQGVSDSATTKLKGAI